MGRGRLAIGFGLFGGMIAVLLLLGFWQVNRLEWKRALIRERAASSSAAAIDLQAVDWRGGGDRVGGDRVGGDGSEGRNRPADYARITARGELVPDSARRWLGQFDGEQPGIHLMQALRLDSDPAVLIWLDRGFIANSPSGGLAAVPVNPEVDPSVSVPSVSVSDPSVSHPCPIHPCPFHPCRRKLR